MQALRSADEIRDVNTRYHDVAASTYDAKWGIDFGEVGQGQVLGKLRKLLGSELDRGFPRALEIGAGTGYFSLNLVQAGAIESATCTDISPGMVRALVANAERLGLGDRVRAVRADADSLPFADASFDLVIGHAVLHHLPDLERSFAEFRRVLRPGGRVLFAGEPSRFGDRLARLPKQAAHALAPAWRAVLRARPATTPGSDPTAARPDASGAGDASAAPRTQTTTNGHGATNGNGVVNGNGGSAAPAASAVADHALEHVVDIHAFVPGDLARVARACGFEDVEVRGEELLANWFGWFNRGLEATAQPEDVPMLWRRYAFHGYLILQRLDERALESRLPAAIFYNLLLTARRP